jgi:hypothetical protein
VQRIGYPLLTWLLSFGQHAWVPAVLVAVNVLSVGGIAMLGGMFAREAGRHALWGLLPAGYFGFVLSIGNDLTEPLAAACLLGGLLAGRRGRPVLAGALLAYGALTRETVMIAVAAIALTRLIMLARQGAWPGRADLAWASPVAAFAGWQLIVRAVTGTYPMNADSSSNAGLPFEAAADAVRTNVSLLSRHNVTADLWVLELVILAAFALVATISLRSTTAPAAERLAFVFFLVEPALLSGSIWNGYADFRSLDELYLFAAVIILGSLRRLGGLAALVAPTVILIAIFRTVG